MIAQALPALNIAWAGPTAGEPIPALAFTTQPRDAWDDQEQFPIVVTSSINTFNGVVTLSRGAGTGTAVGTLTQAAVAGVATFPTAGGPRIQGSGVHTWLANAPGHDQVESTPFDVATGTGVPSGGGNTNRFWFFWRRRR